MFQDNIGNIVGLHIVLVDSSTHVWWLITPVFLYWSLYFEAQGNSQPCFFLCMEGSGSNLSTWLRLLNLLDLFFFKYAKVLSFYAG